MLDTVEKIGEAFLRVAKVQILVTPAQYPLLLEPTWLDAYMKEMTPRIGQAGEVDLDLECMLAKSRWPYSNTFAYKGIEQIKTHVRLVEDVESQ